MPSNKHLVKDESTLLKDKLQKLSAKLQGSLESSELQTQEAYLFEAIKLLRNFYSTLNDPQLKLPDVRANDIPDIELYQEMWDFLLDDLVIIFSEIENIESLAVSNFNFATTESNRLISRLKSVSSKLGDYILHSLTPTKDTFFFKDSFNDLSKIDSNSALLNFTECEINQDEGVVTLPISRNELSLIVVSEDPIVNPSSNGVVGNNQELDAQHNGNIKLILDNNADTWFEYERVTTGATDTKEPLILGITVNIGFLGIINHIRINPNNFGTKTTIEVDSIDTSIDGQEYTSIKDDIPISGFITEDEENIFSLAPSTSKFAGQGIYTFTPRKVKYIRFLFRQTEPYIIDTPNGERLRYAIGIRDIDIRTFTYANKGEFISKLYESADEIRKVSIMSNQNPSELSELTTIEYFVSPDDGGTWHAIQPQEITGTTGVVSIPEVVEFNGVGPDTIVTSRPVVSLRVKVVMSRIDLNFSEGSSTLKKRVELRTESHAVPISAPFELTLERPPVDGSVRVVDPLYGSRGLPQFPYYLGHTSDRLDLRTYRLPFKNLPRPIKKVLIGGKYRIEPVPSSEWMHIEIGGKEWTHATAPLASAGATDEVFTFDPNAGVLRFGDNTNGKAPAENEPIGIYFDSERIYPSETENVHAAKLEFFTSGSKTDLTIKRYDKIREVTDVLPRKATVINLDHSDICDTSGITSVSGVNLLVQKDFLNGRDELLIDGDYSIDTTEGILYTLDPTPDNLDVSISYKYQPIATIPQSQWDWVDTSVLRDGVSIKEDAWQTLSIQDEDILMEDDVTVIDASQTSLVKGSVTFNLTSGTSSVSQSNDPFVKEVLFEDGITELSLNALRTSEQIPALASTGLQPFTFTEKIDTDTDLNVTFSNSVTFSTNVSPSTPTANGQYSVTRSSGTFSVFSNITIADPGTVTYFYNNPAIVDNGLYSINYRNGRVYTQRSMDQTWTLKITYEYTDYRAEYRIARLLEREHYQIDITNRIVTINDGEIITRFLTPKTGINFITPFYLVSYEHVSETREDIGALKDFFSPVIKDYALKILNKGKIF